MRKHQLREEARGQECQIRSEFCNRDDSTTVLCHLNSGGWAYKVPDLFGAHGCSSCHQYVDGGYTEHGHTKDQADLALLRGMARTQELLIHRGYRIEK